MTNANFPSCTARIKVCILKVTTAYKSAYKLKRSKYKDTNTKSIHERPSIISHRKQFGHWELDLLSEQLG